VEDRFLYAGLIRLHILHHAVKEPIYGLKMIEELRRHGYALSAGTLYPLLHGLEQRGYLTSTSVRLGRSGRRVYRATRRGRTALASARAKVHELLGELFESPEG
jgi:DNA-binding PadR family transcriptional regulator